MKYPFQDLKDTNRPYADLLKEAAGRVIDSGWYLLGKETEKLEHQLAGICGTRHCVATSNGLDALNLIYSAYIDSGRWQRGDEVIVAANTFIATLLPLLRLGMDVRLADPSETTFGLDLAEIAKSVTPRTKGVVVTHLYGTPAWDDKAAAELREKGIILIEDNAQAIGATYCGRPTGSLGDASAISFYPAKNIGALGDAGALCTDDDEVAEIARAMRSYGSTEKYRYGHLGFNSRIDEMQAAMLSIKLEHLSEVNESRRRAAEVYGNSISHPDIKTPSAVDGTGQVWHQYVLRSPRRDELQQYLESEGVGTMIHYPVPPHRQVCCKGMFEGSYPVTDGMAAQVLSIPIANITPTQAKEIAEIINRFPTRQ